MSQPSALPQSPKSPASGAPKWSRLRSLLPQITGHGPGVQPARASAVSGKTVNITDELITGGLSALMLKMWIERDERGARRIPVLLHRLRIRISDSLHPLHGTQAVFRIECEYANSAARWVVYRQLRDFVSLHTHYVVSNAYNRNIDALPEFPRTSLPYFKFLKKQNRERGRDELGRPEFARLQREALEDYLVGLVRAVMFHPTSNRLSRFLEISALFIRLAQSGGSQAKAGVLQIEGASSTKGAFARKGLGWHEKKKSKWCAVRESYLVVLEDPGELEIFEVFMLDTDFKIERPKRVYRQGLNLLHHDDKDETDGTFKEAAEAKFLQVANANGSDKGSTLHSMKSEFKRLLHLDKDHHGASTQSLPAPPHRHARSGSGSSALMSASFMSSDDEDDVPEPDTPMVDPSTNLDPLRAQTMSEDEGTPGLNEEGVAQENAKKKKKRVKDVSRHTFFIENSQMRLKLFARNTRQMQQWIAALERVAATSHWAGKNRFDSFAPIRLNVAAQWLVDGRDYFWNLSRALLLAKETIYIHDWWLSPELQMRRPGKPQYRLDRLLARKAKEGVKIFIIIYNEVSSRTTPTDSNYTKQKLTGLHENILVQRSPSHFQTGTYYWAHHEKMCVIDEAIAFMGGLDLCFGRWDTAQHVLVDDGDMGDSEGSEFIWPGKDYSNERVVEFHTLNKPEQDMYDRSKVPRMPWHDVALQIVGAPARDLCRHFVQRWNYLLRNKNHSRVMPFLLPPPEFKVQELVENGLTGTCELQICRSAGPWSMGTPGRIEHSIQNAYLKAIQLSEHFVYIENQFFITSTVVNDVKIENKIGDALVHRIIRAHREGTKWKAVIVIPSLPGFPSPIDQSEASAIRIILECQNRTIARGPNSIFSRLRKEDIDPDEYITFFSLRGWGKLKGDVLTTEQVYVHGKTMIVDDRLAIIGSANINERSQRGDRDSELASVIRDTDMIDGKMGGQPYRVGRFAHTLRVRLMREHLGVDVDAMYEEDLMAAEPVQSEVDIETWDPDNEQEPALTEGGVTQVAPSHQEKRIGSMARDLKDATIQALHGSSDATSKDAGHVLRKMGIKPGNLDSTADDEALIEERQGYDREGNKQPNFASSLVPTLEEKTVIEHRPFHSQTSDDKPILDEISKDHVTGVRDGEEQVENAGDGPTEARVNDGSDELYAAPADASKDIRTDNQPPHARQGKNDANDEEKAAVGARSLLRKHLSSKIGAKPWTLPVPGPVVDPQGFEDPISDDFFKDVWIAAAVHNTEIYRKVFHAIPDDLVTTWKQYKDFILHHDRLQKPAKDSTPPSEPIARMPSETGSNDTSGSKQRRSSGASQEAKSFSEGFKQNHEESSTSHWSSEPHDSRTPRPSRPDEPFEQWEREEMEALLMEVRGHLVVYPTRFLEGEDVANNFLFNADRLLPLPIYD
ncbi:phospholipase D [Ramaria rubella]|nr:phospholipase D [Ramaria rubella]